MSTNSITNQSITASEDFLGLHEPSTQAPPNAINAPEVLKVLDNWVCFRHETKPTGETNNVPYRVDGAGHAKSNDPSTWSTFDAALAASTNPARNFDGVSFMLLGTSYLGFDCDAVVQNEILDPFVASILRVLGDPYAELSYSGTGLRVFINCPNLPRPKLTQFKKSGSECAVEIYHGEWAGKPLVVTGNRYSGQGVPTITPAQFELVHLLCSQIHDAKFKALWLGNTSAYSMDDSRADEALCCKLARLLKFSHEKIDAAFRMSGLMRTKWTENAGYYGKRTIAKAIEFEKARDDRHTTEAQQDEIGDEKQPENITPIYPIGTIDGDLIGELTRALTDGTFIPPQFMRENIKAALGLIVDGFVGFPNHEDLHTREYLHNISVYPQSGKGESYKRTSQPSTGFIFELLRKLGVSIVDGGLFGSGEFMVKVLKDAPTHRALARFDEMSEVWAKNRAIGCTLEKKLLTLFESTSAAQGSFKNGVNTADDFHLSLVGDFTKESFDASFTGSGSRGSGYLSRCVFQFADRRPWDSDWLSIDTEKVRRILSAIDARLTEILNGESRYVPTETADARQLRFDFSKWLDTQDARLTPRLKDHLKRDALLRAVLGGGTITVEMMRRSIEWCKNQLDNRLALFPEDTGSPTEIMERIVIKTLKTKERASERELKRACHVNRAGSGGHEVFNRALRSLRFSHEIKVAGTTRSGTPLYELFAVS